MENTPLQPNRGGVLYGQLAGKQAAKSAHLFALTPGAPLTVFLCVCVCAWECVCVGGVSLGDS